MIGVFIVGMPLPVNWAVCWPSSEEKGKLSSESVTSWSSCVLSWVGAMDTVEIVPDLCKPVASCGMISEYVSSSDSSWITLTTVEAELTDNLEGPGTWKSITVGRVGSGLCCVLVTSAGVGLACFARFYKLFCPRHKRMTNNVYLQGSIIRHFLCWQTRDQRHGRKSPLLFPVSDKICTVHTVNMCNKNHLFWMFKYRRICRIIIKNCRDVAV